MVPDDLCKMISEARHDNKFNVVSIESERFLNIQSAYDAFIYNKIIYQKSFMDKIRV